MIHNITILGAGTMGQGLARLFARHRLKTTLYDPVQDALLAAKKSLQIFEDQLRQGESTTAKGDDRFKFTTELNEAVPEADLIIECAPEVLQVKRSLFDKMGPLLKEHAVVVSNTSTYPLSVLSDEQVFADRFIIAHFFNPPDVIPLVEIVEGSATAPGVANVIAGFLRNCGKVPVILKKDINGFVANRLQAAVLREAFFLVESGVVDAEQLDTVMKESVGIRWALMGPFEIADYGGLDIWEKVLSNLFPRLSNEVQVPSTLRQKVEQHQLGLKTGKGFFDYASATQKLHADWMSKLEGLVALKGRKD